MIKEQLEKLQQWFENIWKESFDIIGKESFFNNDLPDGELPEDWEEREEWKQ